MSANFLLDAETGDFIASFSPSDGPRIDAGDSAAEPARRPVAITGHHFAAEPRLMVEEAARTGDITPLTSAPGCYSIVLAHDHGLAAYTDPVGQFPLFSTQAGDRVLVGPSASALAAAVGAAVDHRSLVARIACPDTPDLFPTWTMFQGVSRIPEGTVFRADARGVRHAEYRRIRTDPTLRPAAAAAQLRARLVESVHARVGAASRLTTDFSGGFDSTSLAFLAASEGIPVGAFTSYLEGDTDDAVRARRYARLNRVLVHRMVPGMTEDLPFQNLVAASDEPHATPFFLGPMRARLAAASDLGADLHLVGEGGDVVLGAPPAYLADLIRSGDVARAWQHCVTWARLRTRSPLTLFRRAVALAMTSRRQALLALARDVRRGRPAGLPAWEDMWLHHWGRPRPDWLTVRARRQLAAELRALADEETGDDSVADLVTRSLLRTQTLTQRAVRDAGRTLGITVHAPFLDSAVVRACLSLPARHRIDLAEPKPLLRNALSHLVPNVVLAHPAKGDYRREVHYGARQAAPALRRLLAESAAADHGLLEPGPVRVVLDHAIEGRPTPWGALNQVLAVELWLRETPRKVATS